ncbi:hypothetical protein [Nostoc sp. 2RC]|uniref:hypothetical protein n=1 Tax=Nostoc sp. 2RC TaxID=2485484 RepID=UPI001625F67F|nr:hypothetical protein [Nostoc sp. 2RC]MBC1239852.1 hypothetical protein [Nostoc sp. 2RC]
MPKINFKRLKQTLVASTSLLSFSISFNTSSLSTLAQTNDPRWYAVLTCGYFQGLSGAKATQLVVDTSIDPVDAANSGFVAHPLWLNTGSGSWVEVGYDKEPYVSPSTTYYWASYTPTTETYSSEGTAIIGTYKELKIIWNTATNKWNFYYGGQKIGEAANTGGPNNSLQLTEAGLESTSESNSSPKAPVYGFQYATLSNPTLRDCANPSLYSDLPARIYWVNYPFSAETVMP